MTGRGVRKSLIKPQATGYLPPLLGTQIGEEAFPPSQCGLSVDLRNGPQQAIEGAGPRPAPGENTSESALPTR